MGPKTNPADERPGSSDDEREMAWAKGFRSRYDKVTEEPLPDTFRDLLEQIDDAELDDR